MIGACYAAYTKSAGRSKALWVRDMVLLSIVFVFGSVVGAAAGYFVAVDTTYFFALGTGTSIYAAMRLVGPLFTPAWSTSSREVMRIAIALLLGFLAIYTAALFHS